MDSTLQNSSSISEQKYINLRKRLDQLGYRQTLGIESLPLIEKLFNDLVHTTESLKKSKLENNKNLDSLNTSLRNNLSLNASVNDSSICNIQAYKSDNAKLIKENNELHIEIIKIRDEFEENLRELKINLNKVNNENSDLRFLNTQYLHKLRTIERESKDKNKKILDLQEKNFQAVIQTPSENKQTIAFRRQRLDIDCMLPQESNPISNVPNCNDPYIIDMIKLADQRMSQIQKELEDTTQCKEILETKLLSFKNQVDTREKEIERLNRLLDGGRSHDVVTLEGSLRNNEKVISHQNIQIEFLQDKNHQLELKIQELLDTKRQMFNEKHKNEDLNRGIKEIKKCTEIEKQRLVNAADRELDAAKHEVQRTREEICTLDINLQKIEKENRDLHNQINILTTNLDDKINDMGNLNELICKIQDDKSKQSKKISKLIENERELVTELDNLKNGKRNGPSSRTRCKSLTAKLDSHIKNIENERDYFKQEVDSLQKLLRATNIDFKEFVKSQALNRSTSRSRRNSFKSCKEATKSPAKTPSNRLTSPSKRLETTCSGPACCFNQVIPKMCSTSTSPVRNLGNHYEEVCQLKRERDELQCLLDKLEIHMTEIQANVQVLSTERDRFSQLYEESEAELQATRRDAVKSHNSNARSVNASLAAQSVIKRVENERDIAICDLKSTTNEREVLKERLKITTDNFIKEKASLEQQIEDLQVIYKNNELEKKQISEQCEELRRELRLLESKLHEQNCRLVKTSQDLNDQKSTSTQIRLLAEESERAIDEQQRQLHLKNNELHDSEQNIYKLEQKLYDLQELNKSLRDEINGLRSTIGTLDKDKDKLMISVDEKTVENVGFRQDLAAKNRCISELQDQLNQLEAVCDRCTDENKQKQKEITGLRIQLDRSNETNTELNRHVDTACRENKRLQDDLITITRENQVIHCELDKCSGDKEQLKEKLLHYTNDLSKTQEIINQKEQERNNLLEQYRSLNTELNSSKLTLNSLESDCNNLQIEVQMKNNDNKRLRERQEILERDLQQQFNACQEYEVKLSGANRNLQRLEETFNKLQAENKDLAQDLVNTRELSSRLEQAKEELMRQVTTKELDCEQLQNELSDKRAENDLLKSQVNSERGMVKNLEELIACNREKDFQMQLSTQERDSEIKLLKDRICLSEQKIQCQNKEITTLRSKLVENESDIERMKRQLTNERFEREKSHQELRKYQDGSVINELSSRFTSRCHSPIRACSVQPTGTVQLQNSCSVNNTCGGVSGATAAVAAARAAIDASNQTNSFGSCYRSVSPIHTMSPCKESQSHSNYEQSSNMRYSMHYEGEKRQSPCRKLK